MTPKPEDLPDVILTVIPIRPNPVGEGSASAPTEVMREEMIRASVALAACELRATPARDPFPIHSICYVRTGTPAPEPWRLYQWGISTLSHPLSGQVARSLLS